MLPATHASPSLPGPLARRLDPRSAPPVRLRRRRVIRHLGRLAAAGLHASLVLSPDSNGYYPDNRILPADLFDDDAEVGVAASGGDLPAFSLATVAVSPIEAAIEEFSVTLIPHQDHVLHWTSADDGARVRVTLNSNNLGHGQPYFAIIECDVPDSAGGVTIPAALVDAFPESHAWEQCVASDCPRSWIRRYRIATSAVPDGEVALIVASEMDFDLEHTP
jgi:hypothetical protein